MGLVVQIGADVRSAVKGIDDVTLRLKDQKAILASLQKQYAALSTAQTQGRIGKELAADIKIAQQEIKRLEAGATSSFGKIGGAATKGFSAVRNLAYILPGIGIAGIFSIAADGIGKLVTELFKVEKSVTAVKAAQESLNKAFKDNSYTKAVTDVKELAINIDLAKKGFLDKNEVLRQYNETLGESLGKVNSLDEAEKILVKNGAAYIQMTLLKAAANIALEEAAKKAVKAALIPNEDIKENLSFFKRLNLPFKSAPSRKEQETKFLAPVIAGVKKEQKVFEDIAADFQKQAAEIAKKFNIDFFAFKDIKPPAPKPLKIKPFVIPEQELEFKLKLEPAVDYTRFRQVLLNQVPLTVGELVRESIAEANRKLADKFGPEKNNIIINANLKIQTDKQVTSEIDKVIADINSIIQGVQIDSLANIGEAIGAALSGGDLKNVFAEFGNIIGEGLKAVGKQIIKVGVIALLAKKALTKLFANPALAIAAGIALVAAGAALKNALSGGLPGRHAGGPVSGGQTYLVGENGPEIFQSSTAGRIIPTNQFGGIQGSAAQLVKVEVNGRLQMREIVLGVARELKYQQGNV